MVLPARNVGLVIRQRAAHGGYIYQDRAESEGAVVPAILVENYCCAVSEPEPPSRGDPTPVLTLPMMVVFTDSKEVGRAWARPQATDVGLHHPAILLPNIFVQRSRAMDGAVHEIRLPGHANMTQIKKLIDLYLRQDECRCVREDDCAAS